MVSKQIRSVELNRRKTYDCSMPWAVYQARMKQAFNKKVRPREFQEGDLVLKKILSFQPDSRGKWSPNYEGPFVVKRTFSGGAMTLATMDGDELPHPVNADAVKKYFV